GDYPGGSELRAQPLERRLDELLALDPALLELLRQPLVLVRPEEAEREVLQLPLELPEAQPIGEWREHGERLAADRRIGDTPLGDMLAQRLQARGQADEHDADVDRHRHRHSAQHLELALLPARLVLLDGPVDLLEPADLAHALHQPGNLG